MSQFKRDRLAAKVKTGQAAAIQPGQARSATQAQSPHATASQATVAAAAASGGEQRQVEKAVLVGAHPPGVSAVETAHDVSRLSRGLDGGAGVSSRGLGARACDTRSLGGEAGALRRPGGETVDEKVERYTRFMDDTLKVRLRQATEARWEVVKELEVSLLL